MIRHSVRSIVLALLAVFAMALAVQADTYYVRQNGNDQSDGKSANAAFRTITRAAQALNHGDSIVIGPGTYRESVFLAERFGTPDGRISVSGDESGKRTGDAAGPVVLEPATSTDAALHFYRLKHLTVSGLTVRGNGQGIMIEDCRDATVERCSFLGATRGLILEATNGARVESCVFARCVISAFLHGTVDTRIAHVSVASSSSAGLLMLACGQGAIRNCLLTANNTAMVADKLSAPVWSSDCNVIRGASGPWGDVPGTLNSYEWTAACGQERCSVYVVPSFADPANDDFHIDPAVTWAGGLPGMNVGQPLDPKVELDRDGKPFRTRGGAECVGAYDYPNPAPAAGWRKLTAKLPAGGPRQSAAVYREDGTLVRTLLADAAGVQELWWDGLDDLGQPAGQGQYQVKAAAHDVRVVDDGAFGDNGNPKGIYNCDNADRVLVLPDGGFIITAVYDEAGYTLRRYAASGQSIFASAFAEGDYWGLALNGDEIIGGLGKGKGAKIVRLVMPGERAPMANGAEFYPVLADGEKDVRPAGVAVVADTAFVSIPEINVVRAFDLANGRKRADYPVPDPADIAAGENGTLWLISGKDVVSMTKDGKLGNRYPTGLAAPLFLAASKDRLAAVDRSSRRIALLDAASGKVIRTIGKDRAPGQWTPVSVDILRDPRGAAFLTNGSLLLTEAARVRSFWPETLKPGMDILSNFMDVAVIHPTKPEYLYCSPGVFRVDPKTGSWEWLVEEPQGSGPPGADGKPTSLHIGSPSTSVVLDGKPFIVYYGSGLLRMLDVSDPLKPREALKVTDRSLGGWAYATIAFTKGGSIISGGHYSTQFIQINYKGLDGQGNPIYDFANPVKLGPEKDPLPRAMKPIAAISADRQTADIYYLAVTDLYNKMVPAWGADGTGVGRSTPDGRPLWFSLSSGGNYMSISTVNDGKNAWVMAGKSFGGQIDLFDADGLRLATGNWSWPVSYQMGFVDLRYGVNAYMRTDGKPGAYVEDDAIGRFTRCRVDGAETLKKTASQFTWDGQAAPPVPGGILCDETRGRQPAKIGSIPRVPELKIDGDWSAWQQNGISPQIFALPSSVGFKRVVPGDLLQSFRAGTMIGAIAHDGSNFYVYFLAVDDTPLFHAEAPVQLWMYDSFELWLEEEQFGIGILKNGTPTIFKYRHHDRAGKEWSANYLLPRENVWGQRIPDLSTHPLGKQLEANIGVSMQGKGGFALMARIPFDEVKLVGGIAGRESKVVNMTGQPGEIIRVALVLDCLASWGRGCDFQVDWPTGKMFSDPTRSYPFALK